MIFQFLRRHLRVVLISLLVAPVPGFSLLRAEAKTCETPQQLMNDQDCWWATYVDPYSGATLDYPADLLRPEPGYAEAAGHRFVSADGKVTVSVWGSWVGGTLTSTEAMATDIYRSGFETVTEKTAETFGYRIAGRHGAHHFIKRVRWPGKDSHIAETMCISWPASSDPSWRALAERIADTLREGRGWARNPRLGADEFPMHEGTCLGL